MLQQVFVCFGVGLAAMAYLVIYERIVMVPGYQAHSAGWIAMHRDRWIHQRDSVLFLFWPAAEEAVARGVPMLLVHDRLLLAVVLFVSNVGFMAGHRDRDIIGTKRWLARYLTGAVILVPAIAFGSLYGCWLVHSAWNGSVLARRWRNDRRNRIIVWTAGPLEVLLDSSAEPSVGFRKLFRRMQTVTGDDMLLAVAS